MKKLLSLLLSILLITITGYSQAPGIFNYQGVARNSVGSVLPNKNITMRLSIHDGTATGIIIYSETRNVRTNPFGLFNVQVGSTGATAVSGSITGANWAAGNKFIQVEIDPAGGSSFLNIGTAQLASVPYALNAMGAAPIGVAGGSLTGNYPNPLIANAAITQSMLAPGITVPPNGAAGGDLIGTYPNPKVIKIQNVSINATAPVTNQVLQYNGTDWKAATLIGLLPAASNLQTLRHDGNNWVANSVLQNDGTNIGIGTVPSSSAKLDISSTTSGFLTPRMTTIQRTAIATPATGLQMYDTDTNSFWFFNGAVWTQVSNSSNAWSLTGNAGINAAINFIGTTDNLPLRFRVNDLWAGEIHPTNGNMFLGLGAGQINTTGTQNTAIGQGALTSNTGGQFNTAIGYQTLYNNNSGYFNTANGYQALFSNNTGYYNTANGYQALFSNTSGNYNTANGYRALYYNTTASNNVAIGYSSLLNQSFNNGGVNWNSNNVAVGTYTLYSNKPTGNFNGINNTAIGNSALFANTTGRNNTATGMNALYNNTTGEQNTAIGKDALLNNDFGFGNTATGFQTMYRNNSGDYNTANGYQALFNNTGDRNTAIGHATLSNNTTGSDNTAIGDGALSNLIGGNKNIAIGYLSGTAPGSPNVTNTISIGNDGKLNAASNQVFIGNTSMTWIGGQTTWFTYASDKRVKNNIKEDVKGLDFILRLHPVTYNLDIKAMAMLSGNKDTEDFPGKYDVEKIKQSGFLAQQVEEAATETGYDFSGIHKPTNSKELYSLSYESFVVPLVKAVQEQQVIIEKQNKLIDDLMKRVTALEQNK